MRGGNGEQGWKAEEREEREEREEGGSLALAASWQAEWRDSDFKVSILNLVF
jgi:hypothetical protein